MDQEINFARHPVLYIIILMIFIFAGMFVLSGLGGVLIQKYYGIDFQALSSLLDDESSYDQIRLPFLFFQAFSSIGGFIIGPLVFMIIFDKSNLSTFSSEYSLSPTLAALITVGVIAFMPFNGWVHLMNKELTLPADMSELYQQMVAMEELAEKATILLTGMKNIGVLFLGIIVIALIPAFGEELVFRKLIQNKLFLSSNNAHLSIWFAAFLFSFFHFQFFGFVPRLLLGAIFGYFYYWSGNFIYPVIGHFANNSISLILVYLSSNSIVEFDPDAEENISIISATISLLLSSGMFYYFHKLNKATE